jgi:hypothetical protein
VDGLVLGSSEAHFGNELKIKLGDEAEERDVKTQTLHTSKGSAPPRVSIVHGPNTGAERKGWPPAGFEGATADLLAKDRIHPLILVSERLPKIKMGTH